MTVPLGMMIGVMSFQKIPATLGVEVKVSFTAPPIRKVTVCSAPTFCAMMSTPYWSIQPALDRVHSL
jgi:hypothetical protein